MDSVKGFDNDVEEPCTLHPFATMRTKQSAEHILRLGALPLMVNQTKSPREKRRGLLPPGRIQETMLTGLVLNRKTFCCCSVGKNWLACDEKEEASGTGGMIRNGSEEAYRTFLTTGTCDTTTADTIHPMPHSLHFLLCSHADSHIN